MPQRRWDSPRSSRRLPGRLSVGGDRRSLIWASFSPSAHCTSRVRSKGQLELQSADTAIHEHPDNSRSRRPADTEEIGAHGPCGEALSDLLPWEATMRGWAEHSTAPTHPTAPGHSGTLGAPTHLPPVPLPHTQNLCYRGWGYSSPASLSWIDQHRHSTCWPTPASN